MRTLLFVTFVALVGCPPSGEKKAAPTGECKKFGDTCEVSPGKLGSCVQVDGCTTEPCLKCQSQH